MKVVVNIPNWLYNAIIECKEPQYSQSLGDAVRDGTPLPKGHGDLIDADRKITVPVYDEQYEEWEEKILTVREALNRWSDEGVTVKDIVLLADEAESEEKE